MKISQNFAAINGYNPNVYKNQMNNMLTNRKI